MHDYAPSNVGVCVWRCTYIHRFGMRGAAMRKMRFAMRNCIVLRRGALGKTGIMPMCLITGDVVRTRGKGDSNKSMIHLFIFIIIMIRSEVARSTTNLAHAGSWSCWVCERSCWVAWWVCERSCWVGHQPCTQIEWIEMKHVVGHFGERYLYRWKAQREYFYNF